VPGLDPDALRAARLRAQHLTGPRPTDVAGVVGALAGVQAQEWRFARLAIRARTRGLICADVDRARDVDRSIVWTWAMRGTLHLLAAEDARWMIGLLGPIFAAAGRRRRLALGLDDELCERALERIRDVLPDAGALTRAALVERIGLSLGGQAPAHLVAFAAMRSVVCRGPSGERGEPMYVLLDDWLGAPTTAPFDADRAAGELVRRYLASHGPAGVEDFAAWSGIGMRRARRGFEAIASRLREMQMDGAAAWTLKSLPGGPAPSRSAAQRPTARGGPAVSLLGHFDPWLLGYARRDLVLDPRFARRIQAGGGFIQPAVLVDGRVAGTWRGARRADGPLAITVEPFADLDDPIIPELERETADIGRFLGAQATLTMAEGA